ncbi:hypothetical protein MalM25_18590 [Planctomycetes bacterium MalM25]|nr:hypothetical protein MalM25_18590 [Planctomycetes bacterium MalM25]
MVLSRTSWLKAAAAALCGLLPTATAVAYTPVPVSGAAIPGPGMLPADMVWGKEYSHDLDVTGGPGAPLPDPEQVILWDGGGGTADGVDYSGARPNFPMDRQVDAIANTRDALYNELRRDEAGLAFSHDDEIIAFTPAGPTPVTLPSAGPLPLPSGMVIGGTGELSIEYAGAFVGPAALDIWAKQPEIDSRSTVDGFPMPRDVDGVEVWGPEPGEANEGFRGDADKYSLEIDYESGFSVWNASGTPYLPHAAVVSAIESLLGPVPDEAFLPFDEVRGRDAVNLDALMVHDLVGSPQQFNFEGGPIGGPDGEPLVDQEGTPIEPNQEGDSIIFSIRQMMLPGGGYYATGSELFVLDSFGGASYLVHGGHKWDSAFALSELSLSGLVLEDQDVQIEHAVIDINAIEAIGDIDDGPSVLPGDYNLDGKVDAADYTVWRDTDGSVGVGLAADGDGDGDVDVDDYLVWKGNYGAMAMSPAMAPGSFAVASAVPEPTAAALVVLALGGVALRRREG